VREVILAKTAGFCFGVRRAVELAERIAEKGGSVASLGPIIHNRHEVERLQNLGVSMIENPEEAEPGSQVLIRSHGVGQAVIRSLKARGAEVIDATCPDVKKIHRIIETAAQSGRQVIMVGKREHPEVIAACGWCEGPVVVETAEELEAWVSAEENREKPAVVGFVSNHI